MNKKIILILIASIVIPSVAEAGDRRCRTYQPRPVCRVVTRPVCHVPVYHHRPTYSSPQYSSSNYGYRPSSSYGYRSYSSLGSVNLRVSTPFAYNPPPTNYGASGLGSVRYRVSTPFAYTPPTSYGSSSISSFRVVPGMGQYVPHANGAHYNPGIRLVPSR